MGDELTPPLSSSVQLHTFCDSRRLWRPLVLLIATTFAACGGGSSGGGQSPYPPATPDFALWISPTTLYVQDGQSETVSLSATGTDGFSSPITLQVSGLPAGVTVSPSSLSVTPGTPLQITISAATSAPPATANVTFTGASGTKTHSAQLSVTVSIVVTSNTPPFRMRYVRTDAEIEYYMWNNPSWIVYNPPTNRFFVTDAFTNRVIVLDATTESIIGTIIVPGAFNLDDTADHTSLYVSTQIGDVYVIDPVRMVVTKRYVWSQIGTSGFMASSVLVMKNGNLALIGDPDPNPSINGNYELAFWNPTTNSLSNAYEYMYSTNCGGMGINSFLRTPDRTKVLLTSGSLCEIDSETGTAIYQPGPFSVGMAFTPDGKSLITFDGGSGTGMAHVLDAGTLGQQSQFPVIATPFSGDFFFVGPDSQTLYVNCLTSVYAYNLSSGQLLGWLPNIFLPFTRGSDIVVGPTFEPEFEAMDGTGLLVGPAEEGVGFLDTTTLRTGAVGSLFSNSFLNPATGPTAGGTQTSWVADGVGGAGFTLPTGTVSDVYFGSLRASAPSLSASAPAAITPPGAPGPADVYLQTSDGGVQYVPEGFSYGPTVLEITPKSAAAGGGPGVIFGYGFGPMSGTTIPANLKVTVGGTPATITGIDSNIYGEEPPFPLQAFSYTIPPGTAGSSADVVVTSSSGSVTVHSGINYLPAFQQFPLPGASLAQGVYDPNRDVYYFTDATEIRVFSRTQGAWLAPITFPASYTPQRLWGIALSPDGSKLTVTDIIGGALYVLTPGAPSAVQEFPPVGTAAHPIGVAISDAGIVYFWVHLGEGSSSSMLYRLDTNSGATTAAVMGGESDWNYLRIEMSADNSTIFSNESGNVFTVNTSTNEFTYPTWACYNQVAPFDLSLSANQARLAASFCFSDSNLNEESRLGLNLRESLNISYLYGQKLSPDGSLLFQPTTVGLDAIDGRLGILLNRIALPFTLSSQYDALVSDGKDDVLVAITGTNSDGVAVIDLQSIPAPPTLSYETGTAGFRKSQMAKSASRVLLEDTTGQPSAGSHPKPVRRFVPYVTKPISQR